MQVQFNERALSEYMDWQREDRKTALRLNKIIQEIVRAPFEGIGKPEPLRHEFAGYWSRRIDEKNRIVYIVIDDVVRIVQCKGHY